MKLNLRSLAAIITVAISPLSFAQTYPAKPIHVIVGFGAGGVTDVVSRIFAEQLAKNMGQPVIVENRPGANALIAGRAVRTAPADGYTFYSGAVTTFSPTFIKDGPINADRDLTPVAGIAFGDYFAYVSPALGVSNLKELAAWAKANPNKLKFGAQSIANTMVMAMLSKHMGFDFENIPYKTADQLISSLISGDIQITFNGSPGFSPLVQNGRLKAIAVFSSKRSVVMPEVSTAIEQGVPFEWGFRLALWGPPGLSVDIAKKINHAAVEALKNPTLVEKMTNASLAPAPATSAEMLRSYEADAKFYMDAARIVGYKPE